MAKYMGGMSVFKMRKGMHLGQPTPLSAGLVKQGQKYNQGSSKPIGTAKNPAASEKHMAPEIKLGRNIVKV